MSAVGVGLAFHNGGYFVTSWGVAAVLLWGLFAASLIVLRGGLGGLPGFAALFGLLLLGAWQGLSSLWANEPSAAVNAMNLTLMYAAVVGLGLVLVSTRGTLRQAQWCALGVAVVVAAGGVGARLLPDHIGGDQFARLNTPISYWNALGALLAFGVVLAVGLGGDPRGLWWARGLAIAAVPLLALGVYLTLSRGAIALLGLALIALIALAPGRLETFLAVTIGAAAAAPAIVMAAERELTGLGAKALPTALEPRRDVLVALVLCSLAAGSAALVVNLSTRRVPERPRRYAGGALIAVAVVAVIAGYAAKGPSEGPVAWADDQFQAFKSYGTGERNDASVSSQLATAAGTGRWQNWGAAVDQFREAPLVGTGAGDYRFHWNQTREVSLYVINAHSLYLETLGESGLIGLALLLVPLVSGVAVLVAVLVRRPREPIRRDLVVGSTAAGLIVLHAMGDWDWQLPAVMIPALLVGAGALKAGSVTLGLDRRVGVWAPVTVGVTAVLAVLLVAGPTAGQAQVDAAKAQARAGDLRAALDTARDAASLDPTSPAPLLVQAYVLTDLGRGSDADARFAEALARSPRDWSIMADWAGSLIVRGELRAAAPLVVRARQLNPLEPRVGALQRVLRDRRRAAAAG